MPDLSRQAKSSLPGCESRGVPTGGSSLRCPKPSRPSRDRFITGGGRIPLLGTQDVWQPQSGLDTPRHSRDGHERPEQSKNCAWVLALDTEGYRIEETWDALGMRATRSDDTILDGAFVPDRYVARVLPAGALGLFML